MKLRSLSIIAALAASTIFSGCSASFSTSTGNATPAKPANSTPAAKSNSNAPANSEKPKATLTNEKKPQGESKAAKKDLPIPSDWIYVYDESKGYGFSVPAGTTGGQGTEGGVDTYVATTPAPNEIGIAVIAFKNKEMSKEDLLDVAVKFMEGMGHKVQPGKLTNESEDYYVAEAVSTNSDGAKAKHKILVGTDVTDNYVMIVSSEESKFAANEKTIDEIWGSFEMWSGGASGQN